MLKYIEDNNDKIDRFDFDYYFIRKNYQMASAIKALAVSNDIQEAYYMNYNVKVTGKEKQRLGK